MAKICMGSGTLALPYAATVGGLLFNIIGLCLIGLWNYYSSNCLLRCLDYLPTDYDDDIHQTEKDNINNGQSTAYGATTNSIIESTINGEDGYIKLLTVSRMLANKPVILSKFLSIVSFL